MLRVSFVAIFRDSITLAITSTRARDDVLATQRFAASLDQCLGVLEAAPIVVSSVIGGGKVREQAQLSDTQIPEDLCGLG